MIKRERTYSQQHFTNNVTDETPLNYGLPRDVQYCKTCVISNQRPNSTVEYKHTKNSTKKTIAFDNDGVCDACRLAERKKVTIDWQERDKELRDLCDRHRRNDGRYDCIVPGSGGKDSFYASHVLRNEYGMNPLTVTWAPHAYTEWGWHNFQAWIHAGHDNYLMTPNGHVHSLLTRLAVENILHPFQPFIFGQKALAPKMAQLFQIPLVFYGENEAEYGNPIADASEAQRDWQYFTERDPQQIFLGGTSVEDLTKNYGVSKADLQPYLPPDPDSLADLNCEVHYLGYYKKWHPQACFYYAVEHGGFIPSPERTPGTYSKYNSIDDKVDDLHYYTTGVKFGIGRATYDAAQEIRSGDITREEGVALVNKYDHEFPSRFEEDLWEYLSIDAVRFPTAAAQFEEPRMDAQYFHDICDSFRSPHLWRKNYDKWELRYPVQNI